MRVSEVELTIFEGAQAGQRIAESSETGRRTCGYRSWTRRPSQSQRGPTRPLPVRPEVQGFSSAKKAYATYAFSASLSEGSSSASLSRLNILRYCQNAKALRQTFRREPGRPDPEPGASEGFRGLSVRSAYVYQCLAPEAPGPQRAASLSESFFGKVLSLDTLVFRG